MDVLGAQLLRRTIEQQQHWRQAAAVVDGRQPIRDPDQAHLVEFAGPVRRYRASNGESFEKRLDDDGLWLWAATSPAPTDVPSADAVLA
jgi:hypothetical protein